MLDDEFPLQTKIDLNHAEAALRRVPGLTWHIPMIDLQQEFITRCKGHRILVVQPTIAAMVYAVNAKTGCFTGFWQNAPLGRRFKYLDFLAEQALPGRSSIICCIIQPHGPAGATTFLTLEK